MGKNGQVTLTALGGGSEIGANCFLLNADGHNILLDCGLHPKKDGLVALPDFSFLSNAPEAVIVSHGHVDHCGAVPYLLKQFPSTLPYATPPTVRIMDRMLHNGVSVMGRLKEEKGISEYPLYYHEDADYAIRRAYGIELGIEFAPVADSPFLISFHHAGHVLGSASILVKTPGHTLYYTGDICENDQELMGGLNLVESEKIDTLVIESTYGANPDADGHSQAAEIDSFSKEITKVIERDGVVLIPAFALGRTQELLNIIARLQDWNKIPDVPVYASGLGRAVYEIYDAHTQYLRPDATLRPLGQFGRVGDVWDRQVAKKLVSEPCIIVASSGMMVENTPSAMIAQEMVKEKRHGIFFVGYLDPDTNGYHLLKSEVGDKILFDRDGEAEEIVLENIRRFYFSAHAPRETLKEIIKRVDAKNVVHVHGDPGAVGWMCENGRNDCFGHEARIGQALTLES